MLGQAFLQVQYISTHCTDKYKAKLSFAWATNHEDGYKQASFQGLFRHIRRCSTCALIQSGKLTESRGTHTWDGCGLGRGSEHKVSSLRLPLLVLCHHVDLILSIPVQGLEHDVVAAGWEPDLWFPFRGKLGKTGRKDTRHKEALDKNAGKTNQQEELKGVNNYWCKIIKIKTNDRTWCLFFTSLKSP